MNKLNRLLKFLFLQIPSIILNGLNMILYDNVEIDDIYFAIIKAKKTVNKISKKERNKIIKEYLDNCYKDSWN